MMKHQESILLVDDEQEILNTYRQFFDKRGFSVKVAHNGRKGLKS